MKVNGLISFFKKCMILFALLLCADTTVVTIESLSGEKESVESLSFENSEEKEEKTESETEIDDYVHPMSVKQYSILAFQDIPRPKPSNYREFYRKVPFPPPEIV